MLFTRWKWRQKVYLAANETIKLLKEILLFLFWLVRFDPVRCQFVSIFPQNEKYKYLILSCWGHSGWTKYPFTWVLGSTENILKFADTILTIELGFK